MVFWRSWDVLLEVSSFEQLRMSLCVNVAFCFLPLISVRSPVLCSVLCAPQSSDHCRYSSDLTFLPSGGADTFSSCLTLSCKPLEKKLEVSIWWNQTQILKPKSSKERSYEQTPSLLPGSPENKSDFLQETRAEHCFYEAWAPAESVSISPCVIVFRACHYKAAAVWFRSAGAEGSAVCGGKRAGRGAEGAGRVQLTLWQNRSQSLQFCSWQQVQSCFHALTLRHVWFFSSFPDINELCSILSLEKGF